MDTIHQAIGQYGFPIVLACWLLYTQRVERRECQDRIDALHRRIDKEDAK